MDNKVLAEGGKLLENLYKSNGELDIVQYCVLNRILHPPACCVLLLLCKGHLHTCALGGEGCSVLHCIGIRDQDGCQARVFCNPTRPKSEPKSATF